MQSVETKQSLRQMFGVRSETPFSPAMEPSVSFAGTNPMDVQADMTPAPQYTESQMSFQRLLIPDFKDQSQPGEGWKRAGLNASILLGATAADLVESNLIEFVRQPLKKKVEDAVTAGRGEVAKFDENDFKAKHKEITDYQKMAEAINKAKDALLDPARVMQGKKGAFDFIEEWASDGVFTSLANGWVRLMTGVDGATYVSETSAFVGDLGNILSQVFMGDKFYPPRYSLGDEEVDHFKFLHIKKAYQTMDFINPVNVEAALRLLEEIPAIGDGFVWLHRQSDKLIKSTIGRWAMGAFGKGMLGYHIGRNVKPI